MAKPKNNSEKTNVTRVKAKDDKKIIKKQPAIAEKKKAVINGEASDAKPGFFKRFFGYFTGSWYELKQVRWPDRRATWGMTAALLIFTALFVLLILVTDILWENLFKLILE